MTRVRRMHVGLVLALVIIYLTGCATTATKYNQQLIADSREPVRTLKAIALAGGEPIVAGKETEGKLSAESAPAQMDSTRSLYTTYAFSSADSSSYKLQVDTDCECWGFNKTVLAPRVVVLNVAGEVVAEIKRLSPRRPGLITPAGMTGSVTWRATPGTYYIVLLSSASETSPTPALSTTAYTPMPVAGIGEIPIYAAPFGPFRLKLDVES